LWIYRPQWHKTEHCGEDHSREIYLGPRAQLILEPFMHTLDYLFTPKASDAWVREQKRLGRKTPMTPSQKRRAEAAAQRGRKFEPFYSKDALARCVKRACRKAALVKGFTPNMLRHFAAGMFRREYGLDSAQILLGHKHAKTTEIYALADKERAMKIMAEVG
jgi:site-specific recombinase XerD